MDLIDEFEALKISALSKSKVLNESIHDVTIGPNSSTCIHDLGQKSVQRVAKKLGLSEEEEKVNKNAVVLEKPCIVRPVAFKLVLREIEFERQRQLNDAIANRFKQFQAFDEAKEARRKSQWAERQRKLVSDIKKNEERILFEIEQPDPETERRNAEIVRFCEEKAKNQLEIWKQQFNKEKKGPEQKVLFDAMKDLQIKFRREYSEIVALIKANQEFVKENYKDLGENIRITLNGFEAVVQNCISGNISNEEVVKGRHHLVGLVGFKYVLTTKLAKEQENLVKIAQQQQEIEHLQKIYKEKQLQQQQQQKQQQQEEEEKVKEHQQQETSDKIKKHPLENHASKESILLHSSLMKFAEEFSTSINELSNNAAYKQLRFDLKKAINIPVNAISAVNSSHLKEKLDKLCGLLNGDTIRIGDSKISTKSHPQAMSFCTELLAKKFVLQSDLMISSNFDAAYAYAYVIVRIWEKFPNFGKLLLANFYKVCPYLVPFYLPKLSGQSDEDFYKSQGYQYVEDGNIEKQDKFLKRMSGFMRLYATILITKRSQINTSGEPGIPYGIVQAYTWFASVMNLPPRPQITATMIHVFLETAGYSLEKCYGKQFKKLMAVLTHHFLPSMEKSEEGGPVSRLRSLINEYNQRGSLDKPDKDAISFLHNDFYV